MGIFNVQGRVENIAVPDRSGQIELIVDTGSEFTWIPGDILTAVGVEVRKRDEKFVMANGEIITRHIGYAILRVDGFETVDEIVFARNGDLSLLGAHSASAQTLTHHAHAISYQFKSVSNPNDPTFTQLLGINDHGTIAGYYGRAEKFPSTRSRAPVSSPGRFSTNKARQAASARRTRKMRTRSKTQQSRRDWMPWPCAEQDRPA